MKKFKISIPKPCHEDWNKMTTNEKGKFCSSCAKTVVDFTKKSANEIQEYFIENRGKRVCGHFKRKQLNSIVIQIPDTVFSHKLSFQKLFILSLLLVMGTTLFSCKTDQNKTQKIEKVELIDTILKTEKVIDTIKVDSITKPANIRPAVIVPSCKLPIAPDLPEELNIDILGDIIDGDIEIEEIKPATFNSSEIIEIEEVGNIITEELPMVVGMLFTNVPPRFKGTKTRNEIDSRKIFDKKMHEFVKKEFDVNITSDLDLIKGKHKIYAQFIIDNLGNVSDVKIKAPHPKLKTYTKELINKLPQFTPGQQNGKNVNVRYILPITFVVD